MDWFFYLVALPTALLFAGFTLYAFYSASRRGRPARAAAPASKS